MSLPKRELNERKDDDFEITEKQYDKAVAAFIKENCNDEFKSENPVIEVITGGCGSGKTSIEVLKKAEIKKMQDLYAVKFNEDYLATYHPYAYDLIDKSPDLYFQKTRSDFVRPAFQTIVEALAEAHVNVVNENVLDGPARDLNQFRAFKNAGYTVNINIMATDYLEARLSCCQRAAIQAERFMKGNSNEKPRGCNTVNQQNMFNTCITGTDLLDLDGLVDNVEVYVRGEKESTPKLVYSRDGKIDSPYRSYRDAVLGERERQKLNLIMHQEDYLKRLAWSKGIFEDYKETNLPLGTELSLQCDEVEAEFMQEFMKHIGTYVFQTPYTSYDFNDDSMEKSIYIFDEVKALQRDPDTYMQRIKNVYELVKAEEEKGILPQGSINQVREYAHYLQDNSEKFSSIEDFVTARVNDDGQDFDDR